MFWMMTTEPVLPVLPVPPNPTNPPELPPSPPPPPRLLALRCHASRRQRSKAVAKIRHHHQPGVTAGAAALTPMLISSIKAVVPPSPPPPSTLCANIAWEFDPRVVMLPPFTTVTVPPAPALLLLPAAPLNAL